MSGSEEPSGVGGTGETLGGPGPTSPEPSSSPLPPLPDDAPPAERPSEWLTYTLPEEPEDTAPADPWRAAAAGLFNLGGLGLGYVLLRRWPQAALCWIATGWLLVAALPADPGGP
ncbi:hypothetical protein ABZZ80_14445, partial [Streptomyces sp. NPDC006356]